MSQPRPATPWRARLRTALGRRAEPEPSAERPAEPSAGRSRRWRLLAPVAFVAAGALFVTSAVSSGGTDLRAERFEDLTDLATQQSARLQRLQADVEELSSDIDTLSADVRSDRVARAQRDADRLRGPAGLTPVRGPGVTITLDDAPEDVLASAGDEVNQAIVHQQDIQAVVNALWDGGAEAMTIQGQRVTSTMGIKCVGNAVVLHGVPYSPPYVISAIGDADRMLDSVDRSAYIRAYLDAVDAYDLGWEVRRERRIDAPASDVPAELRYATPSPGRG
jgi:uncharacterized protein YlxW (UPF0749 family)